MSSTIQIRVDDEFKKIASPSVSMLSENEMLEKLRISREHVLSGKQRSADDVISDMRSKYGL